MTPPSNLPARTASLIGREGELAAAQALLRREEVRLVTFTGAGGTGKTTLALQVAESSREAFGGGVYFVPLAPLADPDLLAAAIAAGLGLQGSGTQPLAEEIQAELQGRQALLLLDNFEHLAPAAPQVAGLLAALPDLKVLVTSRAALRLRGEHEYLVPPLATPDPQRLPPLEGLSRVPSVALFLARARAVKPDFTLTPENAAAVAQICYHLDGLPLAIELAAARTRLLSPPALLARLLGKAGPTVSSPALQLLSSGPRDLPARQRTLRATIAWSADLLDPGEHTLFLRMAPFHGCSVESVEALYARLGEDPADVLDGLGSLLEGNLLRHEPAGGEEPRLGMLQTIREYALEKLAGSPGEEAAVWQAFVEVHLELAERFASVQVGPEALAWLERLEREHDNLRAALRWAEERDPAGTGLRLAGALYRFWRTRGHFQEGSGWLERMLARAGGQVSKERAIALSGAAVLARPMGDLAKARRLYEECLAIRRQLGDPADIAGALGNLGSLVVDTGDLVRAEALHRESLAMYRQVGELHGIANALNGLAFVAMDRGDYPASQALLEESLGLRRQIGDVWSIAVNLNSLGLVAMYRGEDRQAQAFYQESYALLESLGDQDSSVVILCNLGIVALRQGDLQGAETDYRKALEVFQEHGDLEGIAMGLEGMASVAAARRLPERAAQAWGAAEALRERIGIPLTPSDREEYDRSVEKARAGAGPGMFAAAWHAGRELPLPKAVRLALDAFPEEPAPARRPAAPAHPAGLTNREMEVLRLVAQGLSDLQVAEALVISPRTVNAHLTSIYSKLGVSSRAAATRFAVENHLT